MSNTTPTFDFTPTEIVGNLDMVGQFLCAIGARNEMPPQDVLVAAITILRHTRDDIAIKNGIGLDNQYGTPAYAADGISRQMRFDGA